MFFLLSKTVGWLVTPSNFIVALGVSGWILSHSRFTTASRRLFIMAGSIFLIAGLTPFGNWLLVPLEQRFPAWDSVRPFSGIIILGGSISPELSESRGGPVISSGADRLVFAADLARRFPEVPIIFTGGSGNLAGGSREADFAETAFQKMGLATGRVIYERDSRNTIENARFTKNIAKPQRGIRWLLITSAFHMPRAVGLFRKAGFDVEPCPVDWITTGRSDLYRLQTPLGALARSDVGVREWIGLFINWILGNSEELFPVNR
jgi:uncharacterized SAM-binding protein YcdF (DUF218 family)